MSTLWWRSDRVEYASKVDVPLAEEREECLRCALAYPCSLNLDPGMYSRLLKRPASSGRLLSNEETGEMTLVRLSVCSVVSVLNCAYAAFVMSRYRGRPPFLVLRSAVGASRDDELTSSTGGSRMEATFHCSPDPGFRRMSVKVPASGRVSRSICLSVSGWVE